MLQCRIFSLVFPGLFRDDTFFFCWSCTATMRSSQTGGCSVSDFFPWHKYMHIRDDAEQHMHSNIEHHEIIRSKNALLLSRVPSTNSLIYIHIWWPVCHPHQYQTIQYLLQFTYGYYYAKQQVTMHVLRRPHVLANEYGSHTTQISIRSVTIERWFQDISIITLNWQLWETWHIFYEHPPI